MSEVASLSLSKELFKLTEWEDTPEFYAPIDNNISWHLFSYKEEHYYTTEGKYKLEELKNRIPAYSLGYLIRKLPPYIPTYGEDGEDCLFHLQPHFDGKEWTAGYVKQDRYLYMDIADTPENACIKLLLLLIKEKEIEV